MHDIITDIGGSILSAIAFAVLVLAYDVFRNLRLERKIKRRLSLHGMSESAKGKGITLHNDTDHDVRLRSVSMVFDKGGSWKLNYAGPKEDEDHRGIVTLPAFSHDVWILPTRLARAADAKIVAISIEFSYTTLLGRQKLVSLQGRDFLLGYLDEFIKK